MGNVVLKTAPTLEPITNEPMILNGREPKRRRQSGIYQILCKPTGKVYVGSAVWIAKRKRHHREALLAGKHHSQYLQKARHHSDEFKKSVSERFKGKRLTEEHRKKISLAHVGKKQTKEHRFHLALVTAKIKPDQFEKIKSEYVPGIVTMREIATRYGCCVQTVCNVVHEKRMVSA